jgi:hypothetical protein
MSREIDKISWEKGLIYMPPDLMIPIAATNKATIEKYIGDISNVIVKGNPNKALLIDFDATPKYNEKLAMWKLQQSSILYSKKQVWVHVNYSGYRKAYKEAFPSEKLSEYVLDHILNRRIARLKGYSYIRIIPISRMVNTNSGTISEKYGNEYYLTPQIIEKFKANKADIQYADLADVVKMLDLKTGGAFQDGVNEAQKYLLEE